jgi:flagellar biosynthesis protein FlhF
MRVKKYEAKNMREALQMIKNDLGPDAIILSARDNRKAFGLGGDGSVEVTAAVSEQTLHKKKFTESRMTTQDRDRFQQSTARVQKQVIDKMADRRMRTAQAAAETESRREDSRGRGITPISYIDIQDEESYGSGGSGSMEVRRSPQRNPRPGGRNVGELLQGIESEERNQERTQDRVQTRARAQQQQTQQETYREAPAEAYEPERKVSSTAIERIRSAAKEAWSAGLFTSEAESIVEKSRKAAEASSVAAPLQESPEKAAELASLRGEIERLQGEIQRFKQVPPTVVSAHPGADYGISYDLSFMFQKLAETGISPENTAEILTACQKEMDPIQIKKQPMVDAWVARWFLNSMQIVKNPYQGRVHLFVGGSGSGKTASLVKMASHLIVKEKKKIAILTTDSFKVGAVDQLKIYCQILNVPFAVVRNHEEWDWIFSQLKNVDHILVDFPGFQLRDMEEIHLFKSLLPPAEAAAVCHMVVNTTAKDADTFEVCRRYKMAAPQDVIFTNIDQSVQHGVIYNLQKLTNWPLHSFGIGNRIPEDFESASKERVLDLFFKLTKLRKGS